MSAERLVSLPDVMSAINASPNPDGLTMRELLDAIQRSRAKASPSRLTFETHEAVHLGIKFGFLQEDTGLFKVTRRLPQPCRRNTRRMAERYDLWGPSCTREERARKKQKLEESGGMDVDNGWTTFSANRKKVAGAVLPPFRSAPSPSFGTSSTPFGFGPPPASPTTSFGTSSTPFGFGPPPPAPTPSFGTSTPFGFAPTPPAPTASLGTSSTPEEPMSE